MPLWQLKKYKKCCLQSSPDLISYTKEKLDRFHEKLVGELFRHGEQIFGIDSLDEAEQNCKAGNVTGDSLENLIMVRKDLGLELESDDRELMPWL